MEEFAITLAPERIGSIVGVPITNTLLTSIAASAILIMIAIMFAKRRSAIPGRFQAALEIIFDRLLTLMDSVTQDRRKTARAAPIVLTIFLFVLTANLIEILPGVESLRVISSQGQHVALLRSPSSDLNVTLALALIAVGSAHVFGMREAGVGRHLRKYFTIANPARAFIGLLEGVSELAKVISFSFRLFGNIFAGGVLLLVVAALAPLLAPIPFLGLEIFVGFVQALVFSVLALVFITMATETSHG